MTSRARALTLSVLVPLVLVACHRSEELGQLPDDAAAPMNDDAHVDSGCGPGPCMPPGAPCKSNDECLTGFCVTGTCCASACSGTCMVCNAPPAVGECKQLASCSQPLGTACTMAAECASGSCVDGVCCDTACTGNNCMACDLPGAVGTCTRQASCLSPNGSACQQASDCASGFCAGGVCCNSACDGSCMVCDAAGSVGTCVSASACP